jgi:predicted site-specific integrase-resolvase
MKIAALYARVSSAKQQLNENIASQIAAIQEYAGAERLSDRSATHIRGRWLQWHSS